MLCKIIMKSCTRLPSFFSGIWNHIFELKSIVSSLEGLLCKPQKLCCFGLIPSANTAPCIWFKLVVLVYSVLFFWVPVRATSHLPVSSCYRRSPHESCSHIFLPSQHKWELAKRFVGIEHKSCIFLCWRERINLQQTICWLQRDSSGLNVQGNAAKCLNSWAPSGKDTRNVKLFLK